MKRHEGPLIWRAGGERDRSWQCEVILENVSYGFSGWETCWSDFGSGHQGKT